MCIKIALRLGRVDRERFAAGVGSPNGGMADSLDKAKAAFRGLHGMHAKRDK
jgi:hypothetical protein